MGGKALRKCEICGVRRVSKYTSNIFLARFPLEPNRCRLWVKATGNEDLTYLPLVKLNENKFICGDHFPLNMFNENKSRLKKFAVPTLNLFEPPLSDDILTNFPICDTYQEKKGILLDCVASTSKAEAHSDMSQAEKPEHNLKTRKIDMSLTHPPSTSKSRMSDKNMAQFEERLHTFKKHKIDISIDCPTSTYKVNSHYENMPRVEDQAHVNKNIETNVDDELRDVNYDNTITNYKRHHCDHSYHKVPEKKPYILATEEPHNIKNTESNSKLPHSMNTERDCEVARSPFTWQKSSEVIVSDDEDNIQYIDTEIEAADVLLYQDGEPSLMDICKLGTVKQNAPADKSDGVTEEEQQLHCESYKCNICTEPIKGFRYRCVQCADYDLCGACEARGAHESHYVLRIPGSKPYAEVESFIKRIRKELMAMNNYVLDDTHMMDSMKEEIKEELDDPLCETTENYEDERMDRMSTTYESSGNNHSDNNQSDDNQSDDDQSDSEQSENDTDKECAVEDNEDMTSEITNCSQINKRVLRRSGLKNSPKQKLSTSPTELIISNVGLTQKRQYTNQSSQNSAVQQIVTSPPNTVTPMSQSNIIIQDPVNVHMNTSNQHLLAEQIIAYNVPQVHLKCLTAREISSKIKSFNG